ncbi:peptidase [Sessilibacter corallicola]|uniref:peptidase n=1 Tax=Sessilibacter corallicola TaxID=2904075 RepID=UPI001E2B03F1|nr:peptidase [Sessilibacter corallicola]MCE2027805.1 peptidase [Sessilibacter corallicola]
MTYCIAINLDKGLLFGGDTRTNAGVDHISTYKKLFTFSNGSTHAIAILCSGNLATSQHLIESLRREIELEEDNLLSKDSLFDCAKHAGRILYDIIQESAHNESDKLGDFSSNLLLGGQIKGERPRLFMIYPQGNFIEATRETPYFQIGEHKYGKPIIDRTIRYDLPLEQALNSTLISLDSTIKSNLSVGLPMDILLYEKDSYDLSRYRRIEEYDEDLLNMRQYWSNGLKQLLEELPTPKI